MITSGTSKDSNNAAQRQGSQEPGVVIFAEIVFATLLLYLASQPLEMADLNIAVVSDQEITSPQIASREIARMNPIPPLATIENKETSTDFKSAAGVAVAATDLSTTDSPISN